MAQLIVRNIEDTVKERLQKRALRHGRSTEEEVREILRQAAHEEPITSGGLGTEIASLFSKQGLRAELSELRGRKVKPATFEP